jgi:hypothetical protein
MYTVGALVALLVAGGARAGSGVGSAEPTAGSSPPRGLRAFTPDSWWNTPLPTRTPQDPHEAQILTYLRTGPDSGGGCLKLAGVGTSRWGTPIYWARQSDPEYDVQESRHKLPPELKALRIPSNARPAANNDGSMTIYDLDKGYVVALTDAVYHPRSDTWSASGGTVTYLDSNGLDARTGRSDEPRNRGTHRGNPGAVMAVSWDEMQQGEIRHVLKIASGPPAADRFIFPMVGSDGHYVGSNPGVPPEGLRLRLKPSLDLASLDLAADARVIATAIQRYGVYIGDSGGRTALKVENTVAEGRGPLWNVERDALCGLPFDERYWDVVAESFDPAPARR